MMVPGSVQRDVELKIQEGLNIAGEFYGKTFSFPSISYDLRGKTAGTATYQKNHIRLNATLLMENKEHFMETTVPHELAHLLTYQVFGVPRDRNGRHRPHGIEWEGMMQLLGVNPNRTHSYDTTNSVARKNKQFVWKCENCGTLMSVSNAKHLKMLGGSYHHKCGGGHKGSISFVASPGKMTKTEAVQVVREAMDSKSSVNIPKVEPKKPATRKRRTQKTSNMERARVFVRKNPGLSSSQVRSWLEASLGVSAHSARGIWSKLKKEGLV